MIGLSVQQIGAEALAASFREEVRLFQQAQRAKMIVAARAVRDDVSAEARAVFPPGSPHEVHGKSLGPLASSIGYRTFYTASDVIGVIRPNASAFWGRFQEAGLDTMRKGRKAIGQKVSVWRGKHTDVFGEFPFHLPRRPFMEPVAEADVDKVASILGDSYEVFYTGAPVSAAA